MSNLWKFLDLPLINCEIELDLSWSKECTISEIYKNPEVPANPNANLIQGTSTPDVKFQIQYQLLMYHFK